MYRLFFDEVTKTTTIVLTDTPKELVARIASDILHVAIEGVNGLKGNGFAEEAPNVPSEIATPVTVTPETPTATSVTKPATPPVSNKIVTNPVPEDANNAINLGLLSAPVANAPVMPIENAVSRTASANESSVSSETKSTPANDTPEKNEDFVFTFGGYKDMTIMDVIIANPKKAFSYFKWMLDKGILKSKRPGEDAFKKDVVKQIKLYYSNCALQEDELADATFVLMTAIPAELASEILSLFGYNTIEELCTKNLSNMFDAMTMAMA
jgi:hypothetical protein